ncbi:MAG: hypothetical protein J5634_00760 [Bacilli bacterium]|nr:hypothetical protein [Bacilli bacterium]
MSRFDLALLEKSRNTKRIIIILSTSILFLVASLFILNKFIFKNDFFHKKNNGVLVSDSTSLKPVLYLYPKKETKVTVTFENPDKLIFTYPNYKDKWKLTAKPKGDLVDTDKNSYYALYWEENLNNNVDFKKGYYVTSKEAKQFLEDKLKYIGLNDKERNEFIISWLPVLIKNEKSIVYFELTEERNVDNKINISPKPDSILRVSMHVKKVDGKPDNFEQQKVSHFNRKGFSVIECSGILHA